MHWLYTSFKDYCIKSGIELLREDMKYIERTLFQLPQNEHKSIMKGYCDIWVKCMEEEPIVNLKSNTGRKSANLWLMEQIK